jgi:hypothetical protein
MYPGFPVPNVEPLAIWDTSEPVDNDLTADEDDQDDGSVKFGDEEEDDREKDELDNWDIDGEDQDLDHEEELDDWGDEDENEHEDDH